MVESTDVAVESNKSTFDDAQLSSIKDMDSALAALGSVTEVEDWADYGSGFDILENKDNLIGVPFVILEWRFTKSKQFDATFVSCVVVDEKNNKHIVNDGSTGICRQLEGVTKMRIERDKAYPQTGLVVRNGLRRSDYKTIVEVDGKQKEIEAATYYLA